MIEFFKEDHTYQVEGILTPSATTLIHEIWIPNLYKGISQSVLANAADYGNRVHELIESDPNLPEWYDRHTEEGRALKNYLRLKDRHNIQIVSTEKPVAYVYEDMPLYAGTYDMLGTVNGEISIIDIKTTAKYNAQYLGYQLTLYKMAIEQMDENMKIEKGYCLHLPKKGYANLIPVPFMDTTKIINDIKLWRSNTQKA